MPSPEISVVIPTYRRPDLVVRCLEALAEQTLDRSRFEIAVVDDASGPETVAALDQMTQRLPNLTWASQATNRGPAAARNRAVNLSSSPTILFLDDDVIAPPNLLETHAAFHRDAAPNTGLMGHLGWHPDLTVTPFMQFLDDAGIQFDFPRMPRGIQPTVWSAFYTCNLSMPRDAFDREGGFNEDFPFPACEDSDLGLRLEQHGFVLHYLPEALAWHGRPVTLDDYRDRMVKTAPSKEFFEQLHPDVFPRHPAPRPSTTHRIASAGKRAILKATAPVAPRVFGYDVRSAHYRSELGHAHGVGLARSEASHTK